MQRTKKIPFKLVLGGALLVLWATPALAAPVDFIGNNVNAQLGMSVNDFVSKLAFINTFMHIAILIVLTFVQYLLQADFFTNPTMMSALNNIWRLSRDIMNVGFAIMLIGVALYTIVTANKKFVTEKLSTFVIAVILVNFSWFFPRVIIDVANILTGTIYSVPTILGNFNSCVTFKDDGSVGGTGQPCKVITDVSLFEENPAQYCGGAPGPDCQCPNAIGCYKLQTLNSNVVKSKGAGHVMINALVVNFAKLSSLPKIPNGIAGPGPVSGRSGFFINLQILMGIGVAFVIQGALLLPMIGLIFGLLVRIIILWVTTAFMPFAFLGYVINGKLGTNVFGFETDLWKEFINAAFLPAMVAVPITVGFIMLTTVAQIPGPPGFPIMNIPLIYSVKSWWAMLWIIAAVGILWQGAFTALKKSEITGKFTEKIRGFGENMFGAALKLPLIAPLPVGGGRYNIGSVLAAPRLAADAVRLAASGTSGKSLGELLGERLDPARRAAAGADIDRMAEKITADNNTKKIIDELEKLRTNPANKATIIEDIRQKIELPAGSTPAQVLEKLRNIANSPKAPPELKQKLTLIEDLLKNEAGGPGAGAAPPAPPGAPK